MTTLQNNNIMQAAAIINDNNNSNNNNPNIIITSPSPLKSSSSSSAITTSRHLSPSEERRLFVVALDPHLERDKKFYLLDSHWFSQWCEYVGFDPDTLNSNYENTTNSRINPINNNNNNPIDEDDERETVISRIEQRDRPGPFDNTPLLTITTPTAIPHLHQHLQINTDFVFLNEAAYQLLHSWYSGGPVIIRTVVAKGLHEELMIELHPLSVLFSYVNENGEIVRPLTPETEEQRGHRIRTFSRDATLRQIIDELRPEFARKSITGEPLDGRIWRLMEVPSTNNNANNNEQQQTDPSYLQQPLSTTLRSPSPTSPQSSSPSASPRPSSLYVSDIVAAADQANDEDLADQQSREMQIHNTQTNDNNNNNNNNNVSIGNNSSGSSSPTLSWVLIHELELSHSLEFLGWPHGVDVALEYRHPHHPDRWCRHQSKPNWRDFAAGDSIDALDTQKKWYESIVKEIRGEQILVHFKGWADKWNEWILIHSDRLAPMSLYTTGAKDPNIRSGAREVNKQNDRGPPQSRGAVGLRNLGNTCFMNSIIQCMIQTPKLTDYFLRREYLRQVNRNNPLGWKGKIAEEYAELVIEMWSGQYQCVSPRQFKQVLGEFQPRFGGYQQHDSSEFLSFLLDGLHEDLNLVQKKPVTQPVDSNGRPDEVVAKEAWDRHQMRNRSTIVDLFQGQFKSKVVCPQCHKESITFDPYLFLSLPLPQSQHRILTVVFVPSIHTSRALRQSHWSPISIQLQIPKHGQVADLKAAILTTLRITLPLQTLLVADLWNNRIFKVYQDEAALDKFKQNDYLTVYEVPEMIDNIPNRQEVWTTLQLVHFTASQVGKKLEITPIAVPLVIALHTHLLNHMPIEQLYRTAYDAARVLLNERAAIGMGKGQQLDNDQNGSMSDTENNGDINIQQQSQGELSDIETESVSAMKIDDGHHYEEKTNDDNSNNNNSNADSSNIDPSFSSPSSYPFRVLILDRASKTPLYEVPPPSSPNVMIDMLNICKGHGGMAISCIWDEPHPLLAREEFPIHPTAISPNIMKKSSGFMDVSDCIEAFAREEVLRKSEAWYCSTCKQHQQASKKIDLWTLPQILILHLKRFSFTSTYRDKIDTKVDFPVVGLDLSQWVQSSIARDQGAVYDLYAVSNHYGGLGGGHYTAFAKNLHNKQWYNLDDSHVAPVHPNQVVTEAAYVLFYSKRPRNESINININTATMNPGTIEQRKKRNATNNNNPTANTISDTNNNNDNSNTNNGSVTQTSNPNDRPA